MSIIPEFESRLGEKYKNYLIQIDPHTVTIRERTFTRIMDYPGYIPLIGTGIGLIRMIGALSVIIIAGIGFIIAKTLGFETGIRECKYAISRAIDEGDRGFLELTPCLSWLSDKCDARNSSNSISMKAHGKYIYLCGDYLFDIIYGVNRLSVHENEQHLLPPNVVNTVSNALAAVGEPPTNLSQAQIEAIWNFLHPEEDQEAFNPPDPMDNIQPYGMVSG